MPSCAYRVGPGATPGLVFQPTPCAATRDVTAMDSSYGTAQRFEDTGNP